MSEDARTRAQLIQEINALRQQLELLQHQEAGITDWRGPSPLKQREELPAEQYFSRAGDSQGQGEISLLMQHLQQLQVLHDIEHAILSAQDERTAANAALKYIPHLAPHYLTSSVLLINSPATEARVLASSFKLENTGWKKQHYSLDELSINLEALQAGVPDLVNNLRQPGLTQLQEAMFADGLRACLTVPLRFDGELLGCLIVGADTSDAFQPEHTRIMQEVADSLAVALQQTRLRKSEQQRRREAEVMRDIVAALASASDMSQTLEIILVNLRNVIHYDRAGLFLLDENKRYMLHEKAGLQEDQPVSAYPQDDPIVTELQQTKRPILVADIQLDPRFEHWPDLRPVRSWLGVPLLVGEEVIGFISLGSLKVAAYEESDASLIQAFTSQVAEILEKAWEQERSRRKTEELEVLSNITFALGQAESRENTLAAIIDQITKFFGAVRGVFLFPDKDKPELVIKYSLDKAFVGMSHSRGEDLLWKVYNAGQSAVIYDVQAFLQRNPPKIYRALLKDMQSAALIPLKSAESTFGIFCFTFQDSRSFSLEDINLYNAIAEVAGTFLRRAAVQEALENQVNIRTQHLSSLYQINAVTSEALDLQVILEQVLRLTLDALESKMGAIHLLDPALQELHLVAQQGIPAPMLANIDLLTFHTNFWKQMVFSTAPQIIRDFTQETDLPADIRHPEIHGSGAAYIGIPIRVKNQPLGLLSLFGAAIKDYTPEDITLLATIADQVGTSIERARLIKQAEQAAVVEERQRLARELHDSVTQLLYSQVLFAGAGIKVLKKGDLPLIQQHLTHIEQAARQALKEMRLLVYELRPSDYLDEGLVGALQRRLDAVEKRTDLNAQLLVYGDLDLNEAAEMALYNIAQEALNNILKHSGATSVTIELCAKDGRVVLEVIDNGSGFLFEDKIRSGGMGLTSMQERTAALGGELEILTQPGQGTRVIATIEGSK